MIVARQTQPRLTLRLLTETAREAAGGGRLCCAHADGTSWTLLLEHAGELVEVRLDPLLATAEVTHSARVAIAA